MFLGLSPIRLETYWVMGLYPGPFHTEIAGSYGCSSPTNMAHVTRTILQVANQIQQHGQNGKIHRDGPGTKAAKGDQSSAEGCGHGPTSPENRLFFRSRKVKKPGHFLRRCLIKLGFFREKTTPSSRFPGFCVESHPRSPTDQFFSPLTSSKVQLFCETTGQSGKKVWPMGSSTTRSWKISYRSTPLWAILTRGLANMVLTLW